MSAGSILVPLETLRAIDDHIGTAQHKSYCLDALRVALSDYSESEGHKHAEGLLFIAEDLLDDLRKAIEALIDLVPTTGGQAHV